MAKIEVLQNFIGGEFVPCRRLIDSFNPATGEVHLRIPDSGEEEVCKATTAAKKAFKTLVEQFYQLVRNLF